MAEMMSRSQMCEANMSNSKWFANKVGLCSFSEVSSKMKAVSFKGHKQIIFISWQSFVMIGLLC